MSNQTTEREMTTIVEEWMESLVHFSEPASTNPAEVAAQMAVSNLLSIYRLNVQVAKAEQDMGKVSQIWDVMASLCDRVSHRLQGLCCDTHDYKEAIDSILDLRNRCAEFRDLHRPA